jgi:hypothetical protein
MKNVWIETENVAAFRRGLAIVRDTERGQPGIMAVRGRAGRGKTMAALNAYAQGGGVYMRAWESETQAAMLRRLCREVAGMEPGPAATSKREIIRSLDAQPRVLFLDEADRMATGRMEDLRDIHDETGCPMVLVGEEGLWALLQSRRRLGSRVTQHVEFGPVSAEDVLLYATEAASLALSPEAAAAVVQLTEGDFRLVRNAVQELEQAAAAATSQDVDEAMVRSLKRGRQ